LFQMKDRLIKMLNNWIRCQLVHKIVCDFSQEFFQGIP
jgi:hypothetical protein